MERGLQTFFVLVRKQIILLDCYAGCMLSYSNVHINSFANSLIAVNHSKDSSVLTVTVTVVVVLVFAVITTLFIVIMLIKR